MIPKIIHLCWLSGDPFPADIQACLKTWRDKLKGYTIWLWGKCPTDECSLKCLEGLVVEEHPFDLDSTVWTKQAFEAKKYAFAADYIRLYALYNYGGIYLDADVLVYKPFDNLLELPYFIGCDQIRAFEAAVIGTQPKCLWIKDVLDTYEGKYFIKEDGSYDMMELPVRFHHVLTDLQYHFVKITKIIDLGIAKDDKVITVFDKDYFNSRNTVEVHKTHKSYCAHNYAGSWQKKGSKAFKDKLPKWLLKLIYTIGQLTWARNKYAWFQIPFEKS